VSLTRLQSKVLRYVAAHPDLTTVEIAKAIGHRPYYTHNALEFLEMVGKVVHQTTTSSLGAYRWLWKEASAPAEEGG